MAERLLLVDESKVVREAFESHFSACGFEVETAGSLREAAERLSHTSFTAVVVDVSGPEGLATAAHLRQMDVGDAPVVVLTAYGAPQRAADAARLGVDVFLHKPVSLLWLERLLRASAGRGSGRGKAAAV